MPVKKCLSTLLMVIAIIICMPFSAWGTAEDAGYSDLAPGDIPRPEFEYAVDFEYWADMMDLDEFITPEVEAILDKIGLSSLERTKLIAYQRGDQIIIETAYKLTGGADDLLIEPFLETVPLDSKLLGHMNMENVMMSYYVSGIAGILKVAGSVITDPTVVDLAFGGDMLAARNAKLGFKTVLAQAENMAFDLFEDEALVIFFENPDFTGDFEQPVMPFHIAFIKPTAGGKDVIPDLMETMQTLMGLLGMVGGSEGMDFLNNAETTEISGYDCYYWEPEPGFRFGMVDADGYFFAGSVDGIEEALSAFDMGGIAGSDVKPANLLFYMNYGLYFNNVVGPMMALLKSEEFQAKMEDMPSGLGMPMGPQMEFLDEFISEISSLEDPGWAEVAFSFTGDGFEIREKLSEGMANLSLGWKGMGEEMMKSLFADLKGGLEAYEAATDEAAESEEYEETPAEDLPPGASF